MINLINLKAPKLRYLSARHRKNIILIRQITFLLIVTFIASLLFILSSKVANADMDKWTTPVVKAVTKAPVASQAPSKSKVEDPKPIKDPKTGVSITPRVESGNTILMKNLIRGISKEMGYKKPEWAIAIATCESGLNPKAVGDSGKSWGMWQIHQPSHPTVGKKAFDADWSTRWAIERLKAGRDSMWTCARILSK